MVQKFEQVGHGLYRAGLAAFIAGKRIRAAARQLRRLMLCQLQFLSNAGKFGGFKHVNFPRGLLDGGGKTRAFSGIKFDLMALCAMPPPDVLYHPVLAPVVVWHIAYAIFHAIVTAVKTFALHFHLSLNEIT